MNNDDTNIIDSISDLISSTIYSIMDLCYKQGLRDGNDISQIDIEEAYMRGFYAGKNSASPINSLLNRGIKVFKSGKEEILNHVRCAKKADYKDYKNRKRVCIKK